jgi:hypothetical protein
MKSKDIKVGEFYRLKSSPTYGYVKVLAVIPPKKTVYYYDSGKQYISENNDNGFYIVVTEHTVGKKDTMGFVRRFKLDQIMKDNT